MFKIYLPPEGKLSCPAVLGEPKLRTQIILGVEYLFAELNRFYESLLSSGSKTQ